MSFGPTPTYLAWFLQLTSVRQMIWMGLHSLVPQDLDLHWIKFSLFCNYEINMKWNYNRLIKKKSQQKSSWMNSFVFVDLLLHHKISSGNVCPWFCYKNLSGALGPLFCLAHAGDRSFCWRYKVIKLSSLFFIRKSRNLVHGAVENNRAPASPAR